MRSWCPMHQRGRLWEWIKWACVPTSGYCGGAKPKGGGGGLVSIYAHTNTQRARRAAKGELRLLEPLGVAYAELAQWGRPWCSYRTLLGCGEHDISTGVFGRAYSEVWAAYLYFTH
jgi:hypothetical protein